MIRQITTTSLKMIQNHCDLTTFSGKIDFFPLTWQILSSSRFKGKLNIVEQCVSFISIAAWTYQAMPRMTSILSLSPIYTVFEIHNFLQHLRIFPPFVFS